MNTKPKIAVIHPNSLCCLAMRSILADIAPFVDMFRSVEIASYNSMDEFSADEPHTAIHYFISSDILSDNMPFFAPQHRRCIVLVEGDEDARSVAAEFRTVDIRRPERDLVKAFLAMHNAAHMAHGMQPHAAKEYAELLSPREKDVLALIVHGYMNKEIADRLHISTPTAVFHRRNICEKIGSKSIGRLTIYAVMNGIVDLREL